MKNNYKELKARMFLEDDTQRDLANYLGISESTMNQKLNSKLDFTRNEISQIIKRYGLNEDELKLYFFD